MSAGEGILVNVITDHVAVWKKDFVMGQLQTEDAIMNTDGLKEAIAMVLWSAQKTSSLRRSLVAQKKQQLPGWRLSPSRKPVSGHLITRRV